MILLNDVVHLLAGSALAFLRQQVVLFKIADGANNVGGVLVDIDYPWGGDMPFAQDFAEKALSCSSATGLVQEEIERLPGRINGSIQIHPLSSDFDVGFVNPPRIIGLLQIRAAAFIEFGRITLNPAVDGSVVQR